VTHSPLGASDDWRSLIASTASDGPTRSQGQTEKVCFRSRFVEAAGQGFEPQLPGPEPGVLPLDDPATGRKSLASPLAADYQPIHGNEAFLGLGIDAGDDFHVRLEARAPQLRLQQPVDLVEA
jgi:hypothetical protein